MTDFVFPPHPVTTVPTITGALFPVRRVFCIGQNYADHVKEMGGTPGEKPPVFFTKPADAVVCPTAENSQVAYPPATDNLHFEAEIVVALGGGGRDLTQAQAADLIYGAALGCDLTRRDLQAAAKEKGAPWDTAKAFDQGAVVGPLTPGARLDPDVRFSLSVNDVVRQETQVDAMIYSIPRIIAALSALFELKAGDLIFTGTPEGVGATVPTDRLSITGDGLAPLSFEMA